MQSSKAIITPEGYPFIAYSVGLLLFLSVGSWLLSSFVLAIPAFITLLLTIFVISFFRNPERTVPADPSLIVSPADGTVVYVGPAEQEHLGNCQKISIFMSVFNVHVNRAPFSGTVVDRFYKQGKFYDARDAKASCENEQCGLVMELEPGFRLVCVQIAGLVARRILCYAEPGDHLVRGNRYGMIRFGSRLDVYLPQGPRPLVAVGQKAVAGETPLARYDATVKEQC